MSDPVLVGLQLLSPLVAVFASFYGAHRGAETTRQATKIALDNALHAERTSRHERGEETRRSALAALVTELRMNAAMVGQTHVWHAWAAFRRQELDTAYPFLGGLPDNVFASVQEATVKLERYNALVNMNNSRVGVGTGIADKELESVAEDAKSTFYDAARVINDCLVRSKSSK